MIGAARVFLDVLFAGLWQDALMTCIVMAALGFVGRRLNAATRCVILQTILVAMLLVPVMTTISSRSAPVPNVTGESPGVQTMVAARSERAAFAVVRRIDIALSDQDVLLVTGAWLAGMLFFGMRVALGYLQLLRLVDRAQRLSNRAGVRLFASRDVDVPLMTGFGTPSIIIPMELLEEDGEELECVLLHELAHAERGDVWANLLERIVHALLFGNPAVVLALRAISLEREVACDDRAVARFRNLDTYTRSLAALAVRHMHSGATAAACGAVEFGNAVVSRVNRLEDTSRNGTISLPRYAFGGALLMLLTLILTFEMFAPAVAISPAPANTVPVVLAASQSCTEDARFLGGPPPSPGLEHNKSAAVDVLVSADGKVVNAKLAQSSGSAAFDRAVLRLAEENTYAPAVRKCKAVSGIYRFRLQTSP